jgi:hypothetical protein
LINDGRPLNGLVTWMAIKEYLMKDSDSLLYKLENLPMILKGRVINKELFLDLEKKFS